MASTRLSISLRTSISPILHAGILQLIFFCQGVADINNELYANLDVFMPAGKSPIASSATLSSIRLSFCAVWEEEYGGRSRQSWQW